MVSDVDRGLVILFSTAELFPVLRAYGLSVGRTVEVLDQIGLLEDDRVPSFESWLERLADLAPAIGAEAERWVRTLREGGPRSRPRIPSTAWTYLRTERPALQVWSDRYGHLREVTRDDILAMINELTGHERHHTLSVIRSLCRHCKRNRAIFRDPAARLKVGEQPCKVILPLQDEEIDCTVKVAGKPLDRLVVALSAVQQISRTLAAPATGLELPRLQEASGPREWAQPTWRVHHVSPSLSFRPD